MNVQFQADSRTAKRRLPFECVAVVLQGEGALGAYQAGVYEALTEGNIPTGRGVSIGAINTAIIAGNSRPSASRAAQLLAGNHRILLVIGGSIRTIAHLNANMAMMPMH